MNSKQKLVEVIRKEGFVSQFHVNKINYLFKSNIIQNQIELSQDWRKEGGKNQSRFKPNQPPAKKRTKWTEAITKCKYSARKIIRSIEPLYSTW